MQFQMVEIGGGRVQVRMKDGEVAHVQEFEYDSWTIEEDAQQRKFHTLTEAFEFAREMNNRQQDF